MLPMNVESALLGLLCLERLLHYLVRLWAWNREKRLGPQYSPMKALDHLTRERGFENLESWEESWKAWETDHPYPPTSPSPTEWPDFEPEDNY